MPAYRRPLRLRCNVDRDLRVVTSISAKVDTAPIDLDGHFMYNPNFKRGRTLTRHATRRSHSSSPPRRAQAQPKLESSPMHEDSESPVASPPPSSSVGSNSSRSESESRPKPQSNILKSFYEFIPFVSIALADGVYEPLTIQPPSFLFSSSSSPSSTSYPSSPPLSSPAACSPNANTETTPPIPFTHIIRILHPSAAASGQFDMLLEAGMAWPAYDEESGVAVLTLIIPESDADLKYERKCTLLTDNQLLLARDFLCLALPYYKADQPRPMATVSADAVHVLITAPWPQAVCGSPSPTSSPTSSHSIFMSTSPATSTMRKATATATDILSITAVYLALCSKRRVKSVFNGMEADLSMNESLQKRNLWIWKDRVGEEGWKVLDRIARLG